MKNLFVTIFLLFSIISFSQEEEKIKHNEFKINAFNTIIFKSVEFSYEYLIDSESSFGVSFLFNLQDSDPKNFEDGPYYNEKFAFTPFYRHYFSGRYAWGFFLEAFGMYNQQENINGQFDFFNEMDELISPDERSNNVAAGISVGGKFVSQKGFVFEFYGGIGRNLYTSNEEFATEIVPRLGASLGYRF